MERDKVDTSTRVPLMPPQATLRAFVLHFFVALIALLVFGYAAYLICWWLQPVDFSLWRGIAWYGHPGVFPKLAQKVLWISDIPALALLFQISVLAAVAVWIGWMRRRTGAFRAKNLKLPAMIVIIGTIVIIFATLALMTLFGESSLGFAARMGFKKRVQWLLWLGADPYKSTTITGYDPFYMAYSSDQDEMALLLLNHKAPSRQVAGNHLVWVAGLTSTLRGELNGKWGIVASAELPHSTDILVQLLKCGADPNYRLPAQGLTPFLSAARNGNFAVMKLLAANGAIINASDSFGYTGLHYSASIGDVTTIQYLLDQGLNINAKSSNNMTPLDLASHSPFGSTDAIQLLKSHGAITSSTMPFLFFAP